MGSLYQQKGRDGTPAPIWWVKYYANGRPIRESTGTVNRELAVLNRMLRVAYEGGKLLRLPVIRQLKESAAARRNGRRWSVPRSSRRLHRRRPGLHPTRGGRSFVLKIPAARLLRS